MNRPSRTFPLVPDDVSVISSPRQMQLYEESDLISNIKGDYQDRFYDDELSHLDYQVAQQKAQEDAQKEQEEASNAGRYYAEQAKQAAREDFKRKRQQHLAQVARETKSDSPLDLSPFKAVKTKPVEASQPRQPVQVKPTKPKQDKPVSLSHYSKNLSQETYILADIKPIYSEPTKVKQDKPKKNNYDFLKKSQIYNQEANQAKKERKVAQELNLTRFEDLS